MVDGETILYMLIGGVYLFFMGFRKLRLKRLILNTPTSTIRGLAMGLAEIKGTVMHSEEMYTSPLSKKQCVYYRCQVQEHTGSSKSNKWKTLYSQGKGKYVYVKDDTGALLVDTTLAQMHIQHDKTISLKDAETSVEELLKELDIKERGMLNFKRTIRVKETVIAPGDKLYVLGIAQDNPHVEDGSVQHGYQDIIMARKRGKPFIISTKGEKAVSTATNIWIAGIIAGPLVFVGALWLIFNG